MAGPITHIVLTDKIFDKYLKNFSKKDFFIGVCFSDIRYLKVLDRERTHDNLVEPVELFGNNSFMAGVEFHALIDKVREDFLLTKKNYAELIKQPLLTWVINFFEDEVLYDRISDWKSISQFLKNLPYKQIRFDINKKTVNLWYKWLRCYIEAFSPESRSRWLLKNGFPEFMVTSFNGLIEELKNKNQHRKVILELYNKIEDLIAEYFLKYKK